MSLLSPLFVFAFFMLLALGSLSSRQIIVLVSSIYDCLKHAAVLFLLIGINFFVTKLLFFPTGHAQR
jgi:hypothetical protein